MNITKNIIYIIFIYLIILYFTQDEYMQDFKKLLAKNNIINYEFFDISFFIYCIFSKSKSNCEKVILNVVNGLKKIDIILTKRIYKNVSIEDNENINNILLSIENNMIECSIGSNEFFHKEFKTNLILLKLYIIKYINHCQNKLFSEIEKDEIKNLYDNGHIKEITDKLINKLKISDSNHFYYNVYLIIKESLNRKRQRDGYKIDRRLHIGLILDGNRRFAKKNSICNGHLFGSFNAIRVIHYLYNYGIKECTLYVLSYDNFIKRTIDEKKVIFKIIYSYLLELINYLITCENIYVQFIGEINILPDNIKLKIDELNKTCSKKNIENCYVINYAIAYDGRREIYHSMKEHFLKERKDLNLDLEDAGSLKLDSNMMWLKRDIDFVIRTGGTQRMSSFFPWQTIYSEWYFLDKFWPEVTEEDIYKIIHNYNTKNMNFGA